MVSHPFRIGVLVVALAALAPVASYAQVGNSSGISPPMVIVPQTTPAPQTLAYPPPPIGQQNFSGFQPAIAAHPFGARRLSR
jgi:hypothetical protein